MGGVAIYSTRLARDVVAQLNFVTEDYLPGYGNVARAEIRTTEQALALRRLIIVYLEAPEDRQRIDALQATFLEKGRATDMEVAEARRRIAHQLQASGLFGDAVPLARLDTRLELLDNDRRRYEAEVKVGIEALEQRDFVAFRRHLRTIDAIRDDINHKFDTARADMLILAKAAANQTRARQERVIRVSTLVMAGAAALGLVVAGAVSAGLVRPVRRLLEGAKAVERGALDTVVPVTSRDEIGTLTHAFNGMVAKLKLKERVRETFGKYVDPRIVESLLDNPTVAGHGGERRVMTVFFCDMKAFTTFSEGLTPTNLVNFVNHYLTTMSAAVRIQNGIIDKYIGDAIMAFWGPPFIRDDDQATLACLAALDQMARLVTLRQELPEVLGVKRNLPEVTMRVGIATGEVVVGNIGSDVLKSFTVMGDTVNLASRLEGASKAYGTHILVNEATAARTAGTIETREIDSILVVGKAEPERIFEVLGRKGEVDTTTLTLRTHFAAGLAAYRRQAWSDAESEFRAALGLLGTDGPSRVFLERVTHLRETPPAADWNGVWAMTSK
jgi:adenylate cyclase